MKQSVLTAFLGMLIPATLMAGFSVTPFILEFVPSANRTTKFIEAYHLNDNDSPVPIELSVQVRDVSIDGEIVYHTDEKAAGDFIIYPERAILYPDERQKIQIKWAGNPDSLDVEKVYAIMVNEVKIEEENDVTPQSASGQLQLKTRYAVLAVMKPEKPRPEIQVDSIYQRSSQESVKEMVLVLRNTGSGMQKLSDMEMTVLQSGEKKNKHTFRPKLTKEQTKNSLFPGQSRRFVIPWPNQVSPGDIRAVVSFQ